MNNPKFLKLYEALICCKALRKFADNTDFVPSMFLRYHTPDLAISMYVDDEIVNEISSNWISFTGDLDFPIICEDGPWSRNYECKYDGKYRDASISYIDHAIDYLIGKIVGNSPEVAERFNREVLNSSINLVIGYFQWKVSLCTFGGYWSKFIASYARTRKDAVKLLRDMIHIHKCFGVE